MSYSAGDLASDVEEAAEHFGVPPLPPDDLEAFDMDPESEHDGHRILAERIVRAVVARHNLGAALHELMEHLADLGRDFDICRQIVASSYGAKAREAIADATRGREIGDPFFTQP
jgi:hypothetical protein